jgi:16S rRNA (cytidine1402-2'-O)-methyltransferase
MVEADAARPLESGLYLVSTPIGNLQDLSFRALDVLRRCDLLLAEDTRVAAKLLAAFGEGRRVERFDDHAEDWRRGEVLERLAAGERIALTSDAGTPLISDPGYKLVREAAARNFRVIPVPGASAVLAALTISGLPTDRFLFAGFTPAKSASRRVFFEELRPIRCTLVFYETGPRLQGSLTDMAAVFGNRPAAVARELTKLYETCIRGGLEALSQDDRLNGPRGEIVVVVGAGEAAQASPAEIDQALAEALRRQGPSAAAAEVARTLGVGKRDLYQRALTLKSQAQED